jgi:hypothetical protein
MPTIIAIDVSLSMIKPIAILNEESGITWHSLAIIGINKFLDYLDLEHKMEYVSLVSDIYFSIKLLPENKKK